MCICVHICNLHPHYPLLSPPIPVTPFFSPSLLLLLCLLFLFCYPLRYVRDRLHQLKCGQFASAMPLKKWLTSPQQPSSARSAPGRGVTSWHAYGLHLMRVLCRRPHMLRVHVYSGHVMAMLWPCYGQKSVFPNIPPYFVALTFKPSPPLWCPFALDKVR